MNVEEAAWLLGFLPREIPILIAVKLLKPLGAPARTGSKYFSMHELQQLREDTVWLGRASNAIVKYWRFKNHGRIPVEQEGETR